MSRVAQVIAPSRLHFGLWSLAGGPGRQFGGVGAMVERPGLRVKFERLPIGEKAAAEDDVVAAGGPLAGRAVAFARRWADFHGVAIHGCRINIREASPEHVGLGTGTQLGLAVAAGLSALFGMQSQTPQELALSVGRGLRSAVGTYGFLYGGLIVEQGKLPGEPISPLDCRIDLPAEWRFVLVRHTSERGVAGDDEASAMASLPAVPRGVTEELIAEARDRLVPAAAMGEFAAFADSLYRYGHLSGQCFAALQGGPYNGPVLTSLVERIRKRGYEGVGQSSWGPTLYVVTPDEETARQLIGELRADASGSSDFETMITAPCNHGARIEAWNHG